VQSCRTKSATAEGEEKLKDRGFAFIGIYISLKFEGGEGGSGVQPGKKVLDMWDQKVGPRETVYVCNSGENVIPKRPNEIRTRTANKRGLKRGASKPNVQRLIQFRSRI